MTRNPTIPEDMLLARAKQIDNGTHDAGRVRADSTDARPAPRKACGINYVADHTHEWPEEAK